MTIQLTDHDIALAQDLATRRTASSRKQGLTSTKRGDWKHRRWHWLWCAFVRKSKVVVTDAFIILDPSSYIAMKGSRYGPTR